MGGAGGWVYTLGAGGWTWWVEYLGIWELVGGGWWVELVGRVPWELVGGDGGWKLVSVEYLGSLY